MKRRHLDLAVEIPRSPLEAVMSGEVWGEIIEQIAELVVAHKTTLVFVNTRRLAERVTHFLEERLGKGLTRRRARASTRAAVFFIGTPGRSGGGAREDPGPSERA